MKESLLACLLLLAAQASQAAVISYTSDPFFFLDTESKEVFSGRFPGQPLNPPRTIRTQETRIGFSGFDERLGTLNSVSIAFDSVLTNFASIVLRNDFPVGTSLPFSVGSATTMLSAFVDFDDVFMTQMDGSRESVSCVFSRVPDVPCGRLNTVKSDFSFVLETTDDLDAFLRSNLTDGMFAANLTYEFRPSGGCGFFQRPLVRGVNCTVENGGIWEGGATITYDYDPFSVPAPDPTGPFALVLLAGLCAARQRRRTPCR